MNDGVLFVFKGKGKQSKGTRKRRMGSGKEQIEIEIEIENEKKVPNSKQKRKRVTPTSTNSNLILINKNKKKKKKKASEELNKASAAAAAASEQLRFFVDQFQSAKGLQLSSLELESLKDTCILELPQHSDLDVKTLGENIKAAFGASWKEVLYEGELVQGKIDAGSPAVLIISSSALRSIELLRGFRSFTKECPAVKLFSKHMKIEEQISLLKNRVNIASGTPSRIKKLIDTEALGLSRLQVLLLDMHPDVKGYSLFTLPQVRDEFWDLFKDYFYQPMIQGDLRTCLYGPYQLAVRLKGKRGHPVPDK